MAEEVLSRVQNRPSLVPIVRLSAPPDCLGGYHPHDNLIALNTLVFYLDPRRILEVYLHEARHGFQFHVISHPEQHPDVHPSTIAEWSRASVAYTSMTHDPTPSEVEAYFNNALEIDAHAYVERRMRQIDGAQR